MDSITTRYTDNINCFYYVVDCMMVNRKSVPIIGLIYRDKNVLYVTEIP